MSYVIDRFRRQLQYIDFGGIENTPPLFSGEGEVIVPSGERVTGESPIQANNKVENENKCGSEMDKPYPTEPIVRFGWSGMLPIMYPVTHSATIAVALTQWNMRTGSSHT